MALKPTLPKGTRDFLPDVMLRRNFITQKIKAVFSKYGFLPIETPAMENLSTLTGKYGEEGDKLIFKILNSGDFLRKSDSAALDEQDHVKFGVSVSEKALRYDLTVPFARFVVQNQNDIPFPFRRYQIQPVWRADRPQKGRFREFYQCDADVVGSDSLLLDLEFVDIYREVFSTLGLDVAIKINNRKVLAGLAEVLDIKDRLVEFTVILDKLDKIGVAGVESQLKKDGFDENVAKTIRQIYETKGDNKDQLELITDLLSGSEQGMAGVEELKFIVDHTAAKAPLQIDFTLARGLDYYTGSIFEVVVQGIDMGSVGGGGRYDDLTGIFGKKDLSGIGISFGLDRIYIAMEELNLFPALANESTEVLFINFGEVEALYSMKLANELRSIGVKTEVYPDNTKLKKQMDFANKKGIKYVILIGSEEMEKETFSLKNMMDGEQKQVSRIELLELFSNSNHTEHAYH